MASETVTVRLADGDAPVVVARPGTGTGAGTGPWPAVIMYMDAGGIRPGMTGMAERLAAAGYLVVLPDLFYRYGPYAPFVPREVFAGDFRAVLGPLMATTGNEQAAADSGALLAWLDAQLDFAGGRVGAVGFCMGGGMALTAAGRWQERFAAVASFHGGNLATDRPDSPHLAVPGMTAEVYVAAASDDGSYPPAMAARFEAALEAAGVTYRAETYAAAHGWMMPDFPVYDAGEAGRGWEAMLELFGRVLRD